MTLFEKSRTSTDLIISPKLFNRCFHAQISLELEASLDRELVDEHIHQLKGARQFCYQ